MVLDNGTLFEVHLDDATITPPFGTEEGADRGPGTEARPDASGAASDAVSTGERVTDDSGRATPGRGRLGTVVGLVVLGGVATAVARRRRTTAEDADGDGDADIAVEDAAVEDAAADPVAQ